MIETGYGATSRGLRRPLSLALGSCRPIESSKWYQNTFQHAPKPLYTNFHVPMSLISSDNPRLIEKYCILRVLSPRGALTRINEVILHFDGQKWVPGTQKHTFTCKTHQNWIKNERSSGSLKIQDGRRRHLEYLKLLNDNFWLSRQELFLNP